MAACANAGPTMLGPYTLPLPNAKRIHFNAKKRAGFILKIYEIAKENIEKGK